MSFLLPSFPRRRESIFEIQQLFFKSRSPKFYDGFLP
nr:MAG TPA: hypothetical protein [Inoviridae sp.]